MHDYLLSTEWVRFAFVLGVAVSMVLYEKKHLTTGSIVVPGYIAVFIVHPLVVIATFANALLTYWIVNHILRKYFLLYGRTKFTILAIISTVIQTAMLKITPSGQWLWEQDIPLFIGVGYIVPALIAHDMARQGIWKTTRSVMLAGVLVAAPIAFALLLDLPGVNDLAPISGFGNLAVDAAWLPLAVILSVLASWAVAYNYNLRSGGFVGAAFTGMFMADPWQVLVAVVIAIATYLIVAKFLMNHMILFGRRKFSSMLLVSSVVSWTGLWLGDRFLNESWEAHLGVGSLALTPLLLPGLLANDAQRTTPLRVLAGLVMAGSFVVTATWWIQAIVTGGWLHPGWKIIAVVAFFVLFIKQLAALASKIGERVRGKVGSGFSIGGYIETIAATGARLGEIISGHAPGGFATPNPIAAAAGSTNFQITPWEVWSLRHPKAASDAESWLDAQLGKLTGTMPTLAGAGSHFDMVATSVLETALDNDRGTRRIPRRATPPIYSDERSPLPLAEISETSDASWEAQPASDVSDNTQPSSRPTPGHNLAGSPIDETEEIIRPIVDF